ncbi:AMP-binding protein [Streptacidiphilus sp. PB12-B1b]|uniref:AMP-binding protein n=1 Tax=Streptacidiphilus sp. PB12-B1b TaxID=2705012 RepID=UPI0015F7EA76|nr:AMP-binding protein [Streptacidiphilus sp. PB12-B1b]QMU78226.1 AMP-binding protein [Streptacidiphilus sp. PB12-B1b]
MRPYLWSPWRSAAADPARLAVAAGDDSCTFGELTARADALGRGLRLRGLPDGSVLSTDIATGPRFFALALAALAHGYGLFPVESGLLRSPAGPRLLTDMRVALHVGTAPQAGSDAPALPCPTADDESIADTGRPGPDRPGSGPGARVAAGYLAFATSGTTGEPQAVPRVRPPRPYRGVAVEQRYAAGADVGPHLMANPSYHLGTLGPALYALQAGSAVVVQQQWSAASFVELADRHGVASTMLSPDLLVDVVAAGRAPAQPLRAVFHGGDACPAHAKRAAIDLLGPVLHEYYGTSRSILTEIDTPHWLRRPGSVGRALPGIVLTVERDGAPTGPGELGEITARLRAADSGGDGDEILRTGDVGYLDEEGYLFVVGRAATPGAHRNALLEHVIRQVPDVTDAAVVGETEPVCHVETRAVERAQPLATAIGAAAEAHGLPHARIVLHTTGTLPRTASGKIRRSALTTHSPAQKAPGSAPAGPTDSPAGPTHSAADPTDGAAATTHGAASLTDAPADPTDSAVSLTDAPAGLTGRAADPTDAPTDLTDGLADPTGAPAGPTGRAADPTDAPTDLTDGLADPTGAPAGPTGRAADPTDAPTDLTDGLADPTGAPAGPTGDPAGRTGAPVDLTHGAAADRRSG